MLAVMTLTRSDFSDRIELTSENPQYAMIWLHGLGATCDDFVPVFADIVRRTGLTMKALFPQAPDRPVTISGGMPMPCWYDIVAANPKRVINPDHLRASAARVQGMIRQLVDAGIPAQKIVIAGFSQGGAVALETALTFEQPLAGVICLSTYLALPTTAHAANDNLPVFFAHGTVDSVVPMSLGQHSASELKAMGHPLQWHEYRMDHEVCEEEIAAIAEFVQRQLQV